MFDKHRKEIEQNRNYINDIQALEERMNRHEVLTKTIVSEQVKKQIKAEFETRMSDMESLRKKFNKLQFSEQPSDDELGEGQLQEKCKWSQTT